MPGLLGFYFLHGSNKASRARHSKPMPTNQSVWRMPKSTANSNHEAEHQNITAAKSGTHLGAQCSLGLFFQKEFSTKSLEFLFSSLSLWWVEQLAELYSASCGIFSFLITVMAAFLLNLLKLCWCVSQLLLIDWLFISCSSYTSLTAYTHSLPKLRILKVYFLCHFLLLVLVLFPCLFCFKSLL